MMTNWTWITFCRHSNSGSINLVIFVLKLLGVVLQIQVPPDHGVFKMAVFSAITEH